MRRHSRARDPFPAGLRGLHEGVSELIARHHPDQLAVEDVFYSRNVRTTLTLGHARGVILLAGESAGLTIHEYAPAAIKKAIAGTGAATKEQVQFMLTRLLRLRLAPEPADASDGVAAAVTCLLTAHMHRLAGLVANGAGAPRTRGRSPAPPRPTGGPAPSSRPR